MNGSVLISASDENLQQLVCLVEAGNLESGL
jgi:hypothetical protein